jgi:hypothetical protein
LPPTSSAESKPAMSSLAQVSLIFENVRNCRLGKYIFENGDVAQVMQSSAAVFYSLDRNDPVQVELSRLVWVLRSTILFTLLDFGDPALGLEELLQRLTAVSDDLPEIQQLLGPLGEAVQRLVIASNPKRQWLLDMAVSFAAADGRPIGVFYGLSNGRSPGWPEKALSDLASMGGTVLPIGSKKALVEGTYGRIVVPCGARNAPLSLLEQVVYSGRSPSIDLLLYPGESFRFPRKLSLPDDPRFKARLRKTAWERETLEVPEDAKDSTLDEWANEAFWQEIHQGERSRQTHYVSAYYVLFQDGSGAFLPSGTRIPALSDSGRMDADSDLRLVRADTLSDTDLVVLKAGDSNFLLDEASSRIILDSGGQNLIEEATDWKEALDALLVTHSGEEIAAELSRLGAKATAASIHQWMGTEVLGPGSETVFKALITLLHEKGKLHLADQNTETYADARWCNLQELRGVRHKAGNLIRQHLLQKLSEISGSGQQSLGSRTRIRLDADAGVELLILRVHSVDPVVAFIPPSRLCRIDDLRNNRWLG